MAKSKTKKSRKSREGSPSERDDLRRDAGGYDWGWPRREAVVANMELAQRLGGGGFAGCAYGLVAADGPPFLALIGTNLAMMRSALALLQEWVDLDGPSAINLEILVREHNYTVSLAQRPELLRWRLRGIDTVDHPMVFVTSLAKTLDTKNPFIDELAVYSRKPTAPIWLTVGVVPPSGVEAHRVTHPTGFRPLMDEAILLPGISVYGLGDKRPRHSMMIEPNERLAKGPPPEWDDETPESVAKTRERRLAATMAKTLHVLRRTRAGKAVLVAIQAHGCAPWQVEQAVSNLRLPSSLPYEPNGRTKRLAMIDALRQVIVEPASAAFDPSRLEVEAILDQVSLDCAFVLRRVDADHPLESSLGGRLARLKALGYG